jgi:hypothetical protein
MVAKLKAPLNNKKALFKQARKLVSIMIHNDP